MEDFSRYAVYAIPESGPLADFAAHWLGWDPQAGETRAHPTVSGLPLPVEDITRTPRRYGFHATVKPPFQLAADSSRAALEFDLALLAADLPAVSLAGLMLSRLGRFLALTPTANTGTLERLAAAVVVRLDHHRAQPLSPEIVRRRSAGLTPRQDAHLTRWGYPYVMEEFRFHFTLTGPLTQAQAEATAAVLSPLLAPLVPSPFPVDTLCLFGEACDGRFHLLRRYPLSG